MAIELWQYVIQRREHTSGWWVTLAPTRQPDKFVSTVGPFNTVKAARIYIDREVGIGTWANAKKLYVKVESEYDMEAPPW